MLGEQRKGGLGADNGAGAAERKATDRRKKSQEEPPEWSLGKEKVAESES
jgi:hypothetical protein